MTWELFTLARDRYTRKYRVCSDLRLIGLLEENALAVEMEKSNYLRAHIDSGGQRNCRDKQEQ